MSRRDPHSHPPASFTYDGLGRCVRRTVDGVTRLFTYDAWNPIMEWDEAGNWKAMNLYGSGADEILGRYDATLGPLIYKQDKQGNVTFVLNAGNQTIEKYTYDAYGTPTILSTNNTQLSTSAIGNRFMYTGREYLQELGIYDYRHRYYLPSIGRFLQTDPTGFDAGDMNLFRYCGDNPVDRSDPTGLEYQIIVQDSTHVIINIPIIWKGAGNSTERQAAFTSGIQGRWSGTWDGVTVTTRVTDGRKVDKSLANTVYIKEGKGISGVENDGRTGHWFVGGGDWENVGAHEAGHFLGLKDGYRTINQWTAEYLGDCPVPKGGYDWDNIMVNTGGTPD
jgi:RHS repeat-associated protein